MGHRKNECPENKRNDNNNNRRHNSNRGNNNAGGNTAKGRAFTIGRDEARNDNNIISGTFPLNQRYAHVHFDSGADRNFNSVKFIEFLGMSPTPLKERYSMKIADGKLLETSQTLEDCIVDLLGHKFPIDLMPISLGSFDVVIGMDWLA